MASISDIVTLSNGKKVANFSSPHPFTFEDGTILPAVSNDEAERLKVTFIEEEINERGDIELTFSLAHQVIMEMRLWTGLWLDGHVDVVFVPLPMLQAMKSLEISITESPFRAIRLEDRIKKLVSISKQCV